MGLKRGQGYHSDNTQKSHGCSESVSSSSERDSSILAARGLWLVPSLKIDAQILQNEKVDNVLLL